MEIPSAGGELEGGDLKTENRTVPFFPPISQLMKIVSVLPEDFVEYMRHCKDEDIIRRFSGKTLLKIAGLESAKQRQEVINELMEEVEV